MEVKIENIFKSKMYLIQNNLKYTKKAILHG